MKVKFDEKQKKTAVKRKNNSRKLKPTFYIFILILVLGVISALVLTVLFTVKDYSVEGSSIYSVEEITEASGVDLGDNLIRISPKKAADNIEKALPFIKKAEVKRVFPNTVKIVITAAEEFAQIKSDNGYGIIDKEYKLLEIRDEKTQGLAEIKGVSLLNIKPGDGLNFDNEETKKALDTVRAYAKSNEVNITFYDIREHLSVCFVIDNRIYVEFGSVAYADRKFAQISETLKAQLPEVKLSISFKYWSIDNGTIITKNVEDIDELIK